MMKLTTDTYISTVLFCVVAAIVALGLLVALLYVPGFSDYAFAIITIEIGLLYVIGSAIYGMWQHERKLRSYNENIATTILSSASCPMFYTLGANQTCINSNVTPTHTYQFVNPANNALLPNISLSTFNRQKITDTCKTIQTSHPHVPWMDLRSRCEFYSR
jgi:hypothetical protein